jgi:hypothetical protein
MNRMGNRSAVRTRGALVGGMLSALLLAGTALVAGPAGASSQDVTFHVTPIFFGAVTLGTSTTGQSIVTNTSSAPIYYLSASPSTGNTGAEFHGSAGTCTAALAPSASCNLSVVFAPNAKGLRASTLTVRFGTENAKGKINASASVDARIQGRGVAPTFTLTGGSAGDVAVGSVGSVSATITNTSSIPLTVRGYKLQNVVHNNFKITQNTCPAPVLPGGSCDLVANFKPQRTGSASATLSVSMLLAGSHDTLVSRQTTLSGDGVTVNGKAPLFELTPINFGTVTVGTTATGSVVLTNTSARNETFDKDVITSDSSGAYAVTSNNCPSPIASGSSCDLTITYSPAAAVTHNATLVVTVTHLNAKLVEVESSAQASLTGQGANPSFSFATTRWPNTTVGATSDNVVTVTNTSLVALNYDTASFQGADASNWTLIGSACTGPIAPSGSCDLDVAFSPRVQGVQSATFQVTLDLTVRAHTQDITLRTALTGKGVLPTFTITAPSLASTPKGVSVSGQTTLTNTSNVSLTYDGYGFTGANASDFAVTGTTCSGLIAPSGSCDLTVQFTPSASSAGSESATMKVIVKIAGITPAITTSKTVAVSGTES